MEQKISPFLNVLKTDKKTKAGIKGKRSTAGWNKPYMLEILRMGYQYISSCNFPGKERSR